MRANKIVITTDDLIKALKLPEDTSLINIIRDDRSLDIVITVSSSKCTFNESGWELVRYSYRDFVDELNQQ